MAKTVIDRHTSKTKRRGRETAGRAKARLGPGQLEVLVLGQMRKDRAAVPHTAAAIARGIGRSAGAVANCLARLEEADKVRLARKSPRAYDLPRRGE